MITLINFNKIKKNGVFFNGKKNFFTKFYIDSKKKNIININKEYQGYIWYLSRLDNKNHKSFVKKRINSLDFKLIKGKQLDFWKSNIVKEKEKIQNVLMHYKSIWPSKYLVPFHGDLTLNNIIFKEKETPHFIDWENFRKKNFWGLDISYFLISLIALPAISKEKEIKKLELDVFNEIWNNFFKNRNLPYLKDPFQFIKKNLKKDNFFFKINNKIKNQIYSNF